MMACLNRIVDLENHDTPTTHHSSSQCIMEERVKRNGPKMLNIILKISILVTLATPVVTKATASSLLAPFHQVILFYRPIFLER